MTRPPDYFETIRKASALRWDQLERDPELAGPWHQLFKQVQSPRHVLSELLQNADDAGATDASAQIYNGAFVFQHGGEDFTESNLRSLCGFGRSNKRSLHTIGFRGIGFKSTFSLGDQVDLHTPTLAIRFNKQRFTEPLWLNGSELTKGTIVQVLIKDEPRLLEFRKNLTEWAEAATSLLFFRNLRRLDVEQKSVSWVQTGHGPVPNSFWMSRPERTSERVLLVRSGTEKFPDEAIDEILQERMVSDEEFDIPPCSVELALGAEGRLYVVLPTGVEVRTPFACNAPFIQDPARMKIKEPSLSPTNRWLLQRIGVLAANTMLQWLENTRLGKKERTAAYGLLPLHSFVGDSIGSECSNLIQQAFSETIEGREILLKSSGVLVAAKQAVIVPSPISEIWPANKAAELLDDEGRASLNENVAAADRRKLLDWDLVGQIAKETLLSKLASSHMPRPKTWRALLRLWNFVAPDLTGYWPKYKIADSHLLPVEGSEALYSASEVVRLGEKKLLQTEDDWLFLAKYLVVLEPNWVRYMADERGKSERDNDRETLDELGVATNLLVKMGLANPSDVSEVIDSVAQRFFEHEVTISDGVRLAHIAAKLGATAGVSFGWVTRNRTLMIGKEKVIHAFGNNIDNLLPQSYLDERALHPDYARTSSSCSSQEWSEWIQSSRSGLLAFAPLQGKTTQYYSRSQLEARLMQQGSRSPVSYPYKRYSFEVRDWDFEPTVWEHWTRSAASDPQTFCCVVERILERPNYYMHASRSFQVSQGAASIRFHSVPQPSWIIRLSKLNCLRDVHGIPRKPSDLLRRTPETEPFRDVELFVNASLDNNTTTAILDALGVRSAPAGPEALLDCLRTLAASDHPPHAEVEKWYRRLDQLLVSCSTDDLQEVKKAFESEKLILTASNCWVNSFSVYLFPDQQADIGTEQIRASVQDLTMWSKIGVALRPTADLVVGWLATLQPGQTFSPAEITRVGMLLSQHALRIWTECGHWLNFAGQWVAVEGLKYSISMQSLVPFKHLHEDIKQKTADFRRLSAALSASPPFSSLPSLAEVIEHRFVASAQTFPSEQKGWLLALGEALSRVRLDDADQQERVRRHGQGLRKTVWQKAPGLSILPYIDNVPAGTETSTDVLWLNQTIFVDDVPKARLARRVPEVIAARFEVPEVRSALDYAFERHPEDIRAYCEENFNLESSSSSLEEDRECSSSDDQNASPVAESPSDLDSDLASSNDVDDNGADSELVISDGNVGGNHGGTSKLATARPQLPKPDKPSIIERFARSRGFQRDNNNRFFHKDGSYIRHTQDIFPWEHRDANGVLVRYYWPKDHCLDEAPLELNAEVWSCIQLRDDAYTLILATPAGTAMEIGSATLLDMAESGKVKLYPATYRLVKEGD